MENPHKNPDPVTGNCLDCGTTREAIDDNIFATCEKFTGPHRMAMIVVYQQMHRERGCAEFFGCMIKDHGTVAEGMSTLAYWEIRVRDAKEAEAKLYDSLELLRRESGMDTTHRLSIAEAIRRL